MPNEEINIIIEEVVENIDVNINETVEEININVNEGVNSHSQLTLDDGTNPHGTTKSDVGLSLVPNLDTTDAVNNSHTHSNKSILDLITEAFTTTLKSNYDSAYTWVLTNGTNLLNHLGNFSNPHGVTKTQVGLGSVQNIDTTTTQNINDSIDKRFVTDDQKTVLGNTSGINTGDQDLSGLMLKSNNLSDLTNISIARSNLGIKFGYHRIVSPNFNPASNTTYFFNGQNLGSAATAATTNTNRRFLAMITGRIKSIHIMYSSGLAASAPNNLSIQIDNVTAGTSLIVTTTLALDSVNKGIVVDVPSDLLTNFSVNKGDSMTFRLTTPAFGSAPTNFNIWCELIIE